MRRSMSRPLLLAATLVAASTLSTPPAAAQSAVEPSSAAKDRGLRLTPFVALGDDLAPGGGLSVLFPLPGRFSLEAEASAGRDAVRSGLSLLVDLARLGSVSTYAAVGAGVQRDEVHGPAPAPFAAVLKETEFAFGIGGGASVPLGPRWSYRADFRWYNPQPEWPESWRAYNGLTLRLAAR